MLPLFQHLHRIESLFVFKTKNPLTLGIPPKKGETPTPKIGILTTMALQLQEILLMVFGCKLWNTRAKP